MSEKIRFYDRLDRNGWHLANNGHIVMSFLPDILKTSDYKIQEIKLHSVTQNIQYGCHCRPAHA